MSESQQTCWQPLARPILASLKGSLTVEPLRNQQVPEAKDKLWFVYTQTNVLCNQYTMGF